MLDKANGAPLGISDYKYGLRVSVIALPAPPVWISEKGLEMGGPRAFEYISPFTSLTSTSSLCYSSSYPISDPTHKMSFY